MKTFKTNCGCEIHVIKWSAKANSVTVKNCPLHKSASELLDKCKQLVYQLEFHIEHNNDFGADRQRVSEAQEIIARAEGRVGI
jgi:hypothetical protein